MAPRPCDDGRVAARFASSGLLSAPSEQGDGRRYLNASCPIYRLARRTADAMPLGTIPRAREILRFLLAHSDPAVVRIETPIHVDAPGTLDRTVNRGRKAGT